MKASDTKGRSKVYRGEPGGEFGHGCESRDEHDAEFELGWGLSDATGRLKLCEDAGDLANAEKWKAEIARINAIPKPDEERIRLAVRREPRELPGLAFEPSPEFASVQRVISLSDSPIRQSGDADMDSASGEDDVMTKPQGEAQALDVPRGDAAPQPLTTGEAPLVAMIASGAAAWAVTKPQRYRGYSSPLHRLLTSAHREGKPCPSARDVIEEWRVNLPAEIAQVLPDGINYYDAKGNTKAADLEAIRKAIDRMTSGR